MILLPLVERGKPVACQADWPLFYMNDFSRLGLVVSPLGETLTVLEAGGYTVHADERGHLLEIDSSEAMAEVAHLLAAHTIACETADLISCVYQG